mmetsp:Transcript_38436/g.99478  ORF Transcript_38436/g.99478 Transcript_38436/m.99478 type:complete len:225 (+) Transcript_38436:46-720(+)
MGNVSLCCESSAQAYTYHQLKDVLEAAPRKRVKEDKPEVWITIKQIDFREEPACELSLGKFSTQECDCTLSMSIVGSNLQIVQELGSETALKIMDKVGVVGSTKRGGSELMGKLPSDRTQKASSTSLIEMKEKPRLSLPEKVGAGSGGWEKGEEAKTFEIFVKITLTKNEGDEQVQATVASMQTIVHNARIALNSETLRKHALAALCKIATDVVAQQVKARVKA